MQRSLTPTPTKDSKSEAERRCISCTEIIDPSDAAQIACISSHTLCGECSGVFCESVLAAGSTAVAPNAKCSVCRGPIPSLSLERVLKPEQLSIYLNYMAIHTLEQGESLVSCVNCTYCEVRLDDPPIFWCRGCDVPHCVGCKAKLPKMMEEDDVEDSDDEKVYMETQSVHMFHLQCSALKAEKTAFDKAIASATGMPCPGCGVLGRKDGMCTHMTCSGCSTSWCYLCGLSVDDCDKASRSGGWHDEIYGHNENWKNNSKRCPMYMSMLAEVDDEWDFAGRLEDSDGDHDQEDVEEMCLDKFHRWQTLQKLHGLYVELGKEKWRELSTTFASVRNCDFTEEEIRHAGNIPLFRRRGRYH